METKKETLDLYIPHEGQLKLHNSNARFRLATCGRRWGKTFSCCNEIIDNAWRNKGTINWWVAPVYTQAMMAYRLITGSAYQVIEHKSKTDKVIKLKNGSYIEFRSSDNYDALRGEGVSFMVLDEAAHINRDAWEQALRPTLSDTMGRAMFVSTPKGRNWFFELYGRGLDENYTDYESFKFPTSSNPYINPQEVAEAKRTLPGDVFRQEYEAEFLEDSAGVFRGIMDCVKGDFEEPKPGRKYVLGWDIAKHTDFSVMVVIDIERKHIVAFDRFNQIDYTLQLSRLDNLAKKYNAKVIMDSTGVGDPVLEQVKQRGIQVDGYNFTNTSKQQLIEALSVAIEKQEITFPAIPELIHELQIYQYEITRAGNVRYNAPQGYHDDTVIALGLALSGCNVRQFSTMTRPPGL